MDLFHCFDRILREGVHHPLRGFNLGQRGFTFQRRLLRCEKHKITILKY